MLSRTPYSHRLLGAPVVVFLKRPHLIMRFDVVEVRSSWEGVMDKHNSYDSGMRFLKVSPVNMEAEIGFIDIPIRGPSWDLTLDLGDILRFRCRRSSRLVLKADRLPVWTYSIACYLWRSSIQYRIESSFRTRRLLSPLYASCLFLEMTSFDDEIGGDLVEPFGSAPEEGVYWDPELTEVVEVSSSDVIWHHVFCLISACCRWVDYRGWTSFLLRMRHDRLRWSFLQWSLQTYYRRLP